jgi:hypothetical protein
MKQFSDFIKEVLASRLYADAYNEAVDMWAAFAMWQCMLERERSGEPMGPMTVRRPEKYWAAP